MEDTLMKRDGFKLTFDDSNTFRLYDEEYDGEPIFETNQFRPGASDSIDSDAAVGAVLSFFSLQEGDTDSVYFDDYTSRQIEWRDQRAEDLGLIAFEIEETLAGSVHCAAYCASDKRPSEALLFSLADDGTLDTVVNVFDCLTGQGRDERFSDVERHLNTGDLTSESWEWIAESVASDNYVTREDQLSDV